MWQNLSIIQRIAKIIAFIIAIMIIIIYFCIVVVPLHHKGSANDPKKQY